MKAKIEYSFSGESKTDKPAVEPASFSERAVAFIIDLLILLGLQTGCFLILWTLLLQNPLTSLSQFTGALILSFSSVALFPLSTLAYYTILHSNGGQTFGKLFMGIIVLTSNHKTIRPGIAFLRWAGYALSLLPLGFGFIRALPDKKVITWHDKLAGTLVCRTTQKQLDNV